MSRDVEIVIFVIGAQLRVFSTQLCSTLVHSFEGRGLLEDLRYLL